MKVMSMSESRANYAATLASVINGQEAVVITRPGGENVVMLPQPEYESMLETLYLMKSPANRGRISASISELEGGGGEVHELDTDDESSLATDLLAAEQARQAMLPARPQVDSLDELRGPSTGVVVLPVRLGWGTTNAYDLGDETRRRSMYATVLRESLSAEDLRQYLNAEVLKEVWATLNLPAQVRASWEARHPELQDEHARG